MGLENLMTVLLVGVGLICLAMISFALTVNVLQEFRQTHGAETNSAPRPG